MSAVDLAALKAAAEAFADFHRDPPPSPVTPEEASEWDQENMRLQGQFRLYASARTILTLIARLERLEGALLHIAENDPLNRSAAGPLARAALKDTL